MRYFLLLVSIIVFAAGASAQIELAERNFEEAAKLASRQKYDKATELYERSLQIAEASSGTGIKNLLGKIHYNIGVCSYRLREFAKAEDHFSIAIVLDPLPNKKKFFALSLAQIELGKVSKAKRSLKTVLRIDKEHGEAWFELGMIYLRESSIEKAKGAFLESAKTESIRRSEAVNNLGVIFAMEGDLGLAKAAFEKAFFLSGNKLFTAKRNFDFCSRHSAEPFEKLVSGLFVANGRGEVNG
ncbi:MAG: tetratricopeptide repeat protein [Pyrinomonadaceae bacterium]